MKKFLPNVLAFFLMSCSAKRGSAEPLWPDVCTQDEIKNLPFCDTELGLDERVMDYVNRVPTEVQITMMGHNASGFEDLKIPPYMWWSEGLHGPLEPCVRYKDQCACPTNFPSPSAMGNAFNRTLYGLLGRAIGIEGRAISNLREHEQHQIGDGLTYWSPTINMQRDPRWGRNQEVPGEDPFLTAQYSKAFVQGLQQTDYRGGGNDDKDSSSLKMGACCKHFIGNSLEHWKEYDRYSFDAHIDDEDLNNYYLPPFEECTKHAVGVMCSYNALNGVPTCANDWLLKDVLRDQMDFDGYLVTDCGALGGVVYGHHYAIDQVQASAMVKNATVDVNCGSVYQESLAQAFHEGQVEEVTINESFQRMARIQFRLGLFDSGKKEKSNPEADIASIDSPEHQQLALEAALQSIVLLQNENSLLPLDKGTSLALIGPHLDGREVFMANYHGDRCGCSADKSSWRSSYCIESPLEAIQKTVLNPQDQIQSIKGCNVADSDVNDIEKAKELAQASDAVILFLGIDGGLESEGLDRMTTTLPGLQPELMESVLDVAGEKAIIVLLHGGTISLGEGRSKAGAIVSAGYGGEAGASAIASVLFGDYNPTGKLAATVYPPSFVDDLPLTEMGLRVGVGRTYMYYSGEAEFAFGHGLSYSQWKMEWVDSKGENVMNDERDTLPNLKLYDSKSTKFHVSVQNLGPHAGASSQTILLFWRPTKPFREEADKDGKRKIRQKLIDFQESSTLPVGQSETLEFHLNWDDFAMWDSGRHAAIVSHGVYELVVQVAGSQLVRLLEVMPPNMHEPARLRHPESIS